LIDDLIAVFEISKSDTLKPLVLKNSKGDFSIALKTGNLSTATSNAAKTSTP